MRINLAEAFVRTLPKHERPGFQSRRLGLVFLSLSVVFGLAFSLQSRGALTSREVASISQEIFRINHSLNQERKPAYRQVEFARALDVISRASRVEEAAARVDLIDRALKVVNSYPNEARLGTRVQSGEMLEDILRRLNKDGSEVEKQFVRSWLPKLKLGKESVARVLGQVQI